MKKILLYATVAILLSGSIGCGKEYLETRPTDGVPAEDIFAKLNSVYAALDGANRQMFAFAVGGGTGHDNFGQKSVDLQNDLMGNDMVVHSQGYGWFNTDYNLTEWTRDIQNRQPDLVWFFFYDLIGKVNRLLPIIDNINGATQAEKDLIRGQCLAIRGYSYFQLITLFQQTYKGNENKPGVPIYTAISLTPNPRGTVQQTYDQILADLTAAEPLLNGKPRASKGQIDVTTLQGIRARVALVMNDWATAATYAVKARTGYTLMTAAQYTAFGAFSTASNAEWIWGSTIPADQATIYASFFSHIDIRTGGYAALGGQKKITKALYDQINAADPRKACWRTPGTGTTSNPDYNQIKHQVPTAGSWAADYLYMRASEMYLIEAEALARQSQDGPARTALETVIKARYAAYDASALTGAALLNEILLQRRIELWGEGFGLWDIKRLKQGLNRPTGAGNHGSPNFDPGVYTTSPEDARFIMKIPKRELDNNTSMTPNDQNP